MKEIVISFMKGLIPLCILLVTGNITLIVLTYLIVASLGHITVCLVYASTDLIKLNGSNNLLNLRHAVQSSLLLGQMLSAGIMIAYLLPAARSFGLYICILSMFHATEFLATYMTNPMNLSIDSFLLNHSVQYWVAAAASCVEYWLEWYFWRWLKLLRVLSLAGVMLIIIGETLRKLAMFTAGINFSHLVQYRRKREHELITGGVYGYMRHPSYVGWFLWSIGTQVLLCNPICLLAYTAVTWTFFNDRIVDEEQTLVAFFGSQYVEYQRRVPTGIPFITGYKLHVE